MAPAFRQAAAAHEQRRPRSGRPFAPARPGAIGGDGRGGSLRSRQRRGAGLDARHRASPPAGSGRSRARAARPSWFTGAAAPYRKGEGDRARRRRLRPTGEAAGAGARDPLAGGNRYGFPQARRATKGQRRGAAPSLASPFLPRKRGRAARGSAARLGHPNACRLVATGAGACWSMRKAWVAMFAAFNVSSRLDCRPDPWQTIASTGRRSASCLLRTKPARFP